MKTIGIDQSLWNTSYFEHKCMKNIKNIYQHRSKCGDQNKLNNILDADMLSSPWRVIDDSPNVSMTSAPVKKPIDSKSLCLFTNILDVKQKTEKRRILAAK